MQEFLGEDQLKPVQAKDVRSLSHNQAVITLRRCYAFVLQSLDHETNTNNDTHALGLLASCHKFKFTASLLLFSDVLPHLAKLSKVFQKPNVDFSSVKVLIDGTVTALQKLKKQRSTHLSALEDKHQQLDDVGAEQYNPDKDAQFCNTTEDPFIEKL